MVHSSSVLSLGFGTGNKLLVSGDQAGCIKVWKIADGKCLRQLNVELGPTLCSVTQVRLNP
jgi:WD40 repeat protein